MVVTLIDPSSFSNVADTLPPTVAITTPAASANVDPGGVISLTGTATDNKGVAAINVTFNGASVGPATREKPSATSTTFRLNLGPAQVLNGLNTVTVQAVDIAGRTSSTVTRTFKVLRPLLVGISGHGSVTTGFAPKSYREVGKPYTITATAGTGALFTGWTILSGHSAAQLGLSATALEKNTITFIHRDVNGSQSLALMANFAPNPYTATVAGTYNGGIVASSTLPLSALSSGTPSRLDTEGYFTAKVETTGAFSGSLKIDGMTLPVAGTFDANGVARFGTSRATSVSVARSGKPSLTVLLNIKTGTKKITGTVAQLDGIILTAVSNVDADRAFYSATNPVPPDAFHATPSASPPRPATGKYTMFFSMTDSGGLDSPQVPQGFSHGSVTLSNTGGVTVVGTLADGTPFSQSTTVSLGGRWRLFAQLYPGLQGFIGGNAIIDHIPPDSDIVIASTRWVCPVQDRQHYPLGWQGGITLQGMGSKFTIPTTSASIVPVGPPIGSANLNAGNASLIFSLVAAVPFQVDIGPNDVVTEKPSLAGYSLSINRTLGTFSGTYSTGDGPVPYSGIVYQKGPLIQSKGFGFFRTPTPAVKTYNGLSGSVTLSPQ
jgi:hypothetical protein